MTPEIETAVYQVCDELFLNIIDKEEGFNQMKNIIEAIEEKEAVVKIKKVEH